MTTPLTHPLRDPGCRPAAAQRRPAGRHAAHGRAHHLVRAAVHPRPGGGGPRPGDGGGAGGPREDGGRDRHPVAGVARPGGRHRPPRRRPRAHPGAADDAGVRRLRRAPLHHRARPHEHRLLLGPRPPSGSSPNRASSTRSGAASTSPGTCRSWPAAPSSAPGASASSCPWPRARPWACGRGRAPARRSSATAATPAGCRASSLNGCIAASQHRAPARARDAPQRHPALGADGQGDGPRSAARRRGPRHPGARDRVAARPGRALHRVSRRPGAGADGPAGADLSDRVPDLRPGPHHRPQLRRDVRHRRRRGALRREAPACRPTRRSGFPAR